MYVNKDGGLWTLLLHMAKSNSLSHSRLVTACMAQPSAVTFESENTINTYSSWGSELVNNPNHGLFIKDRDVQFVFPGVGHAAFQFRLLVVGLLINVMLC